MADQVVGGEAGSPICALPAGGQRFYHPELDGLRFIAFLFVFIHHVTPRSAIPGLPDVANQGWRLFHDSGALGVDLFFCLSAYLITVLLLIEWERNGSVSIRKFYLRRLLRIWPLYFAFLGLAMVLPMLGTSQQPFGPHTLPFLLFAGNWSSGFLGYPANVAGPLWSVSLEEQFYILWPPLLRWVTPGRLGTIAWAMILMSIACRCAVVFLGWPHPATWCMTLTRLDCLGVGILIAVVVRDAPRDHTGLQRLGTFGCGVLLWAVGMYFWPVTHLPNWGQAVLGYPMFAVGAGLMLLAALVPPGRSPGVLGCPSLVYLGKISYGLYVFHQLGSACAYKFLPKECPWTATVIALGLTILMAAGSYVVLERPFLLLKDRFSAVRSRPT